MRRLLVVLLALCPALASAQVIITKESMSGTSAPPGPPTRISRVAGGIRATGTSIATTAQNHSGNSLVVVGFFFGTNPATHCTSVTNLAGDTWHLASSISGPSANRLEVWYTWNAHGFTNDVVTCQLDATAGYRAFDAEEWSGVLTTGDPLLPPPQAATGTGVTLTTAALFVPATEALVYAFGEADSDSLTAGPNYTLEAFAVSGDTTPYFYDEYRVITTTSETPSANTIGGNWLMGAQAFKSARATDVCVNLLNPSSRNSPASGEVVSVTIQTAASCAWTAVPAVDSPWLTVTGASSGTGTGTTAITVANNPSAQRAGTVVIGGSTFSDLQAAAGGVSGTVYYVSTTGVDPPTRSCMIGQNPATPLKTIDGGISCLSAGQTLLVRGGVYTEAIDTTMIRAIPSGTSWANKTRIAAYPNGCSNPGCETVTLRPPSVAGGGTGYVVRITAPYIPQYIEFDGIGMDGTNVDHFTFRMDANPTTGGDHIRVQYCTLIGPTGTGASAPNGNGTTMTIYKDAGNETGGGFNEILHNTIHAGGHVATNQDHAIYLATDNNLIDGNVIDGATGAGIHVWNENTAEGLMMTGPTNNIVRNNIIKDGAAGTSSGYGILLGTDTGSLVYNNVIYHVPKTGPATAGIIAYFSVAGAQIYNNTIYNVAGFGLDIDSTSAGVTARNNLMFNNGTNCSDQGTACTTHATPSVLSNNLSNGVDPQFVNAAAGNFRLQNNTSNAYNAGTTIGSFSVDFDGITRPQFGTWDIGAFEFH